MEVTYTKENTERATREIWWLFLFLGEVLERSESADGMEVAYGTISVVWRNSNTWSISRIYCNVDIFGSGGYRYDY